MGATMYLTRRPVAASEGLATADALGYGGRVAIVAGLTATSGLRVVVDMPGRQPQRQAEGGEHAAGETVGQPAQGVRPSPRAAEPDAVTSRPGALSRGARRGGQCGARSVWRSAIQWPSLW